MNESIIHCPACSIEIKLNESLAAPLIEATRRDYEKKLADANTVIGKREEEVRRQAADVEAARASIDQQVANKLAAVRLDVVAEEARKAKQAASLDLQERDRKLTEMQESMAVLTNKLTEAQLQQAEFLKKERALDDEKRELALTVEKKVCEGLAAVRDKARSEAEDGMKLKVAEREEKIAGMQRQIEELRRKSEQGSQQLQGEVLELQLESLLASRFPMDVIEPVAKGEFGGDLLQRVVGPAGQPCGTILWETKRTKSWSPSWLPKLRGDQRAAKAELALLISEALPAGTEHFDLVEGVYVAHPRCALPIAMLLRQSLINVAGTRTSQEGQATKMEQLYGYLTGPRFRHRVEAIIEKFSEMQEDLSREKKVTIRLWAKRENQIHAVLESTVGMYGDMQGIAGKALQEIPALEVPMLELEPGDSESTA